MYCWWSLYRYPHAQRHCIVLTGYPTWHVHCTPSSSGLPGFKADHCSSNNETLWPAFCFIKEKRQTYLYQLCFCLWDGSFHIICVCVTSSKGGIKDQFITRVEWCYRDCVVSGALWEHNSKCYTIEMMQLLCWAAMQRCDALFDPNIIY